MSKPLQLVSEWSGYLNHFPATALLRIKHPDDNGDPRVNYSLWEWQIELYWESQYAVDHKFETGMLMIHEDEIGHDSETEAFKFGERYLLMLGFNFLREVQ